MFEPAQISPAISVTSPEGRSTPAPPTPRRGLSKLRSLTQSRLQPSATGSSSENPRSLSRNYFKRSVSFTERSSAPETSSRRRSASRPDVGRGDLDPRNTTDERVGSTPKTEPTQSRARSRTLTKSENPQGDRPTTSPATMARHRTSNSGRGFNAESSSMITDAQRLARAGAVEAVESTYTNGTGLHVDQPAFPGETSDSNDAKPQLPTIRFLPHQEMRNGKQSLPFSPIARTLPSESSIIRVGRYSEREGIPTSNPTGPSDAPVGFKSKVVSRKHCEFSFKNGQWQLRDVASSSGTFLNHIRLSQPNMDSKFFPVKDGDIVQLGIDFRGGEEMIFRCVKIRIECNRSWQKRPNNFNMSRHAQLQSLAKTEASAQENSGECAICLGAVLPCQSLFVAACAHVWHYKCIRPMLEGKNSSYPHFQCPNCRAWTDLSAEVDVPPEGMDEWKDTAADLPENMEEGTSEMSLQATNTNNEENALQAGSNSNNEEQEGLGTAQTSQMEGIPSTPENRRPVPGDSLLSRRREAQARASNPTQAWPHLATMNSIDLPVPQPPAMLNASEAHRVDTATPDATELISGEGPLTPRNNAGPFVFDGSSGGSEARVAEPPIEIMD